MTRGRSPEQLPVPCRRRLGDRPLPEFGPDARPLQSVTIPPIGIASTDLRRRLVEGRSVRYLVPRAVEAYIDAHGLYRPRVASPG